MFLTCPQVDEKMIKAFGEQLFRSGFIHGDPHPANGKSEGGTRGGEGEAGSNPRAAGEKRTGSERRRQ